MVDVIKFRINDGWKESLVGVGFPRRHVESVESIKLNKSQQSLFNEIYVKINSDALFSIIGKRGTGKTMIATCIAKEYFTSTMPFDEDGRFQMNEHNCDILKYAKLMDFFIDIKSTFKNNTEETEESIIADYANPQFLVLDETAERSESDWENRMFTHLIDTRYDMKKSTLLIGNFDSDSMQKSYGGSICSRLNECGGIIELSGESFRK